MQELDIKIIEMGIRGDRLAFKQLYDFYAPYLWRLILRMTGDESCSRELLQETFVRIHGAMKKFKGNSAFSTWIYKIAHNVVLAHARQKKKLRNHEPYQENVAGKNRADSFMYRELIEKILAELSIDERFLLVTREIDGFSFEEIAEITGVSEGSLRTRLHRLKEHIRKKFDISFEREVCA